MSDKVSILKCLSYESDELYRVISNVCRNSGFPDVKGKKVLLKPNILSDAKPEDCITTNPEFVRAVIKFVKEKGAEEVYVGDSPGLHSSSFCGKNCGIYDVCLQENAIWVNFAQDTVTKQIKLTGSNLVMAGIIDKVDVIISLCKFKTHQLMYATGAAKNMFGTVVGLNKSKCHLSNPSKAGFAKLIVGICQTVKPDFSIMDAIIGMEGAGPANGTPRPVNLIIASENPFAVDFAESVIMGYNPNQIPIIAEAIEQKLLGEIEFTDLQAKNLIIEDFKKIQIRKKNKFISKLIIPFFTNGIRKRKQKSEPHPVFNDDKCIRCQRCVQICPAKALILNNENRIQIDTGKCIRCYCCHEMCPVNAISVKEQ